jgi:hypothetical protein
MNWLANLTGKINGFKEMDLLQEHQNFWAKVCHVDCVSAPFCLMSLSQIIYCAGGSNRSWSWLTMVTVSIFTLRDLIQRVQEQYKTPFNSNSHTSPSTADNLKDLQDYLEQQELQSFQPTREHNKYVIPARNLMAVGAAYANKAGAFKNFRRDMRKATNKGVDKAAPSAEGAQSEEVDDMYHDLGDDADLGINDLAMDKEEFPFGTDPTQFIAMTQEVINELSKVSC